MTIPTSVYVPDATLYASYSQNLVYDVQKALYTMNNTIATFTNGLIIQGTFAGRPAPGTSGRFYFATDKGTLFYDNGSSWKQVSVGPYINATVYSSSGSGTFTPDTRTQWARVFLLGGGGAGGGASATDSTHWSAGAGGTSGGYCTFWCQPAAGGESYTVGAGGTGVSAGTGNGGGTTSFGSWATETGGGGGAVTNTTNAPNFTLLYPPTVGSSTNGGSAVGFVQGYGMIGNFGFMLSPVNTSGSGGPSIMGRGGTAITNNNNGSAGTAPGSGGSGASNSISQGARTGGAGHDGYIVIEEFG